MKYVSSVILMVCFGCGSNNRSINDKDIGIVKSNGEVNLVEIFNIDEQNALDSIQKYGLDSIHKTCLRYLYVIYGNEPLFDTSKVKGLTIGECNIRLIGFKKNSDGLGSLSYDIFIQDTIPITTSLFLENGRVANSFEVNIKNKELTNAYAGEGRTTIKNIDDLYNAALKSPIYRDYISNNKSKLHPKYISLFDSLSN